MSTSEAACAAARTPEEEKLERAEQKREWPRKVELRLERAEQKLERAEQTIERAKQKEEWLRKMELRLELAEQKLERVQQKFEPPHHGPSDVRPRAAAAAAGAGREGASSGSRPHGAAATGSKDGMSKSTSGNQTKRAAPDAPGREPRARTSTRKDPRGRATEEHERKQWPKGEGCSRARTYN